MPLRFQDCPSYRELWNTGGLTQHCSLKADHKGDHTDGTKYGIWHRKIEEKILLEEIKRLRSMLTDD